MKPHLLLFACVTVVTASCHGGDRQVRDLCRRVSVSALRRMAAGPGLVVPWRNGDDETPPRLSKRRSDGGQVGGHVYYDQGGPWDHGFAGDAKRLLSADTLIREVYGSSLIFLEDSVITVEYSGTGRERS